MLVLSNLELISSSYSKHKHIRGGQGEPVEGATFLYHLERYQISCKLATTRVQYSLMLCILLQFSRNILLKEIVGCTTPNTVFWWYRTLQCVVTFFILHSPPFPHEPPLRIHVAAQDKALFIASNVQAGRD